MSEHAHQIDYAPPRRRPVWLNRRTVMIGVLVVASALSAWVVVPRVWHRAELLSVQERLLTGATGADIPLHVVVTVPGERSTTTAHNNRVLDNYEQLAFNRYGGAAIYAGSRHATVQDAPERLLLLSIAVAPALDGSFVNWGTTFGYRVIEPGGWTSQPKIVGRGVVGPHPLPVPPGGHLLVHRGVPDPQNPSRIVVTVEHAPVEDSSSALPTSQQVDARTEVVFHLMPDDTVRIDWPKPLEP